MSKKFVYTERKLETVEQRTKGGADFDTWLKRGSQMFKPKAGKHRIRILPATWEDRSHYGYDVWVNYGVGPDKGTYLSLNKMKSARDPIYEEYVKAKNEGREEDAKNLAARKRILVYVIDRKAEDQGPLLWAMPITIDKSLCAISSDPDTREVLAIDHPDDGFDVTFTKEGDGQYTKYTGISVARNTSPLHDDEEVAGKWLDYIVENPIPSTLNFYSYDHIKRAFTGIVEAPVDEVEVRRLPTKDEAIHDPVAQQFDHVETKDDEEEPPFDVEEKKPVSRLASRLAARRG